MSQREPRPGGYRAVFDPLGEDPVWWGAGLGSWATPAGTREQALAYFDRVTAAQGEDIAAGRLRVLVLHEDDYQARGPR